MASKKTATKAKAEKKVDEEKLAKRKARMEALKNRPVEQRPNSKQIDVIKTEKGEVRTYGYPIKSGGTHVGVLVTTVVFDGNKAIASSSTYVPGNLTIKVKKGHGTLVTPKKKGEVNNEGETED